jgi:hypothetical protein
MNPGDTIAGAGSREPGTGKHGPSAEAIRMPATGYWLPATDDSLPTTCPKGTQ